MARSCLKAVLVVLYLSACIQATQPSIQTVLYNVEVMTSDENGAGTDANVFIKICGKLEHTDTIHLTNPAANLFERGSHDTFSFVAKNVGPIKKVAVRRDTTGPFSDWRLDQIVVNSNGSYTFAFNEWIPANQWIESHGGK